MSMECLNFSDQEVQDQQSRIARCLRNIEELGGNYEVAVTEESIPTPLGKRPLQFFHYYIENDLYPPPELLRYLDKCFQAFLNGEKSLDAAFGLQRKKGRPATKSAVESREREDWIAIQVDSLVNGRTSPLHVELRKRLLEASAAGHSDSEDLTPEPFTVDRACREVSEVFKLSIKQVERIYYAKRDQLELGRRVAKQASERERPPVGPKSEH